MKKPSQCEQILKFFEDNHGSVTLGGLLEAGRFSFAHKVTARLSDLRKRGYSIRCEKGKSPVHNVYTLTTCSVMQK